MSNISKDEFKNALVDVRKAYRLLFLYQKRVLDLVNFIGTQLNLEFEGGYPKFSNLTPRSGKNDTLEKWSWDWLNMYFYEFHFVSKYADEKIDFSILLQSDSGFFEENLCEKLRPCVEKYKPVEKSKSRLIFIVCNGDKKLWEELNNLYSHENINSSDTRTFVKKTKEGGIFISKSYDLSDFLCEEETMKKLEDFNIFCNRNGLEILKIINKKGTQS